MKLHLPPSLHHKLLLLFAVSAFTIGSVSLSIELSGGTTGGGRSAATASSEVVTLAQAAAGAEAESASDALATAASPITWSGSNSDTWTANGDAASSPWQNGAVYADGTPVIFNDSGSGGEVNVTGTVAPGLITVDSNTSHGGGKLGYGYAFAGDGKIADRTDANGNIIQKTALVNEGSAVTVLDTPNSFSGGITMEAGSTLYLGCDAAAGTGNINMEADNTTLIVNYRSDDVSFRTPSVHNTLVVGGNTKITSGVAAYDEFNADGSNRITADWRTLSLSGGITGSGTLSLYGYSYMVKPTTEADKEITFNYVSAIAVNERDAVTVDGSLPSRFTGTVYLKNEFNYQPTGTQEVVVDKNKHVGGALQLTLVDNVFSEAALNLTRDYNKGREAGHNANQGGKSGYGITSDNILLLSESSHITIKSLDAMFRNEGFLYNHTSSGNYALVSSYMEGNFGQMNERWSVRVVTDGYTNLVLEDNSDAVHVFSGSMGFAHSYVTQGQAYIHAPSVIVKGNVSKQDVVVPEPTNPGAGSLGVEQLSLEKRGMSTQYIHTAKLVNLNVVEGVLGFNNLSVTGGLKLAGNSVLRLGVTGTLSTGNSWDVVDGDVGENGVAVSEALRTNETLTIGGGFLEIDSTKQPGRGTLPTTAHVEGNLVLANTEAGSGITFNINSVMPATEADYTCTLLDVDGTLTLWNSTDITLNFSNVNLSAQYNSELTYYLASANDIIEKRDESRPNDFIDGRTITLGSGYYGSLSIVKKNGRDYLAMNVVGDPRRTWSGMISGNYIWQHGEKENSKDEVPDARWKENLIYENGLLVLFGNLYQPEAWDGEKSLDSAKTVNVTDILHSGNVVQKGETDFAIDGVEDSVVGYQKVQIVGEVAPASIVIGADFNLNSVNTKDATNYYFYGDGVIREALSSELHKSFQGGKTGLRKMGAGTAVIATDNSFTGGTVLEGGRIVMQHENALGTGEIYIVNGAVLQGDFADNSADFDKLHAFEGEGMKTTVVTNPVRTSVYVDPANPENYTLVDARISNAHDKKMVLTHLSGGVDTVVTLYGHSQASGQYSYAVFKVLNPTNFSGTVRMDGNLTGNDVYRDLWDDDATNNLAGGNVQMEIMTITKAKDEDGGNWLNTTIDLSVENGTNRTVLALDALGTNAADATQIAQVNALHGGGNGGKGINSSVLSMSEEKTITLQILGIAAGDYDGVLGFGDFQKTVDYTGSPSGIGMVHHHYGRAGSEGTLNVLKEGNVTQSVNSAWLDSLEVKGGSFVVDKSLVVRTLTTTDANRVIVGNVSQSAYPHTLVVGKGGILAIDSDSSVDAFAGIAPGIPKRMEEIVVDGEIKTQEVAPEKYVLFADGATITGFNDWMTNDTRTETINGKQVSIPVAIEIDNGATVTFNTHNYTPDASINAGNDVFGRYNRSHIIQMLGVMTGSNVELIFNNELISAAAQQAGTATERADGLGYTGTVGSEMGYVVIRDHNAMTGSISVNSQTMLQILQSGEVADMDVHINGYQAGMQLLDAGGTQYVDMLTLGSGGALHLGGAQKTSLGSGESAITKIDFKEEGIRFSVSNRYEDQAGTMNAVHTDVRGTATRIGGTDSVRSEASAVHMIARSADGTHEIHDTKMEGSLLQLENAVSVNVADDVFIDRNSCVFGEASSLLAEQATLSGDFREIELQAAGETLITGSNTTIELTVHGGTIVNAAGSMGEKKVYHAYTTQLKDVNVQGDGVTINLTDMSFFSEAHRMGADFIAVQIEGSGEFRYEKTLESVAFEPEAWKLYNVQGSIYNEYWLSSSQIMERYGVTVSSSMLYFMVPEPTTATLSLLALSMLASRRRRK